jgi:hypothetical protein
LLFTLMDVATLVAGKAALTAVYGTRSIILSCFVLGP